jgi:hypothetical protein
LEKGRGKLVRLGDIAEVRRGFTTGANEFFYLEPVEGTVEDIRDIKQSSPDARIKVKNRAGWEGEIECAWLHPVVKSPREVTSPALSLKGLRQLLFMPPADVVETLRRQTAPDLSRYANASDYIRHGERQGYHERPTCRSRKPWWNLGDPSVPSLLWSDAYNHRFVVPLNTVRIYGDKRFFFITTSGELEQLLAGWLNSSLTPLFVELEGITNLGEGVVYTNVYWLANYRVFADSASSDGQRIAAAFSELAKANSRSIFEDYGFHLCRTHRCAHPEHPFEQVDAVRLSLEQIEEASPEKFKLDQAVFDALSLSDKERLDLYRAVAVLVKGRLTKARSINP